MKVTNNLNSYCNVALYYKYSMSRLLKFCYTLCIWNSQSVVFCLQHEMEQGNEIQVSLWRDLSVPVFLFEVVY